jgi:hypothetical protein
VGREFILGLMAIFILDLGKMIKCKDLENFNMLQEVYIKGTGIKIK